MSWHKDPNKKHIEVYVHLIKGFHNMKIITLATVCSYLNSCALPPSPSMENCLPLLLVKVIIFMLWKLLIRCIETSICSLVGSSSTHNDATTYKFYPLSYTFKVIMLLCACLVAKSFTNLFLGFLIQTMNVWNLY